MHLPVQHPPRRARKGTRSGRRWIEGGQGGSRFRGDVPPPRWSAYRQHGWGRPVSATDQGRPGEHLPGPSVSDVIRLEARSGQSSAGFTVPAGWPDEGDSSPSSGRPCSSCSCDPACGFASITVGDETRWYCHDDACPVDSPVSCYEQAGWATPMQVVSILAGDEAADTPAATTSHPADTGSTIGADG